MINNLGARGLSGVIYGMWGASVPKSESDKKKALERSIAGMKEVMKVAEDNDVTLNLEVVNRYEQFLLNTAAEAAEYIDTVGSTHCKILLDTFHMNIEERSFSQAIITAGSRLGHFHLGEPNRRPPESGRIPWDEVISTLCSTGYHGALVMEPFTTPNGEIGRDIRLYRDLGEGAELDKMAEKAFAFIKGKVSVLGNKS
jgi:D-psicose/D-tagatose/L-ribulose 3-epimerase